MVLLLIILACLLWLIYIRNKGDILNPALMFCASFVFSSIWAAAYVDTWDINICTATFFVIFGGVVLFFVTNRIINSIYRHAHKKRIYEAKYIHVDRWKMILIIFLSAISCIWVIRLLLNNGLGSTLSIAMHKYRLSVVNNPDELPFNTPRVLTYLRSFALASSYWFAYILANNIVNSKKKISIDNLLMIAIIALGIISACLYGGRQQFINVLLAFFGSLLYCNRKIKGTDKTISFKTLLLVILGSAIALYAFKNLSGLVGKEIDSISFTAYIAKYCGAPIKNLDSFLRRTNYSKASELWGFQTFRRMYEWFGYDLPQRDFPFQYYNGFNIGNAYTTFYDMIYDFGFAGMAILVIVMSILVSWLYYAICNRTSSDKKIILCAIWGFQLPNILLSFFSDEFYEFTFSRSFARYLLGWIVLYILCNKIKFRVRKAKR